MRKIGSVRVGIGVVRSTNGSVARFCSVLGLGLLIAACGRTARQDGPAGATAGASAVGGSDAVGAGVGGELQCPEADAPHAPLRLLREDELRTDLSDAFGLPVEIQVAPESSPYWAADFEPAVSTDFVYGQAALARELSQKMSEPAALAKLTQCDVAVDGEQRCRAMLRIFVHSRLFRILGDDQTLSELDAVFDSGLELGGDFHSGARAMLEVALQSPEYLYHLELGRPAADRPAGWGKLTDLELASRLSFLLWATGPDDELLGVALQGVLSTPVELENQARRLLRDERARVPVRRFYRGLMGVAAEATLGPRFPDFTAAIAQRLPAAFDRFIDDVTWGSGGDFRTLLRSPRAWFDSETAGYYGVAVGAGAELQLVEQDPAYYSGLLTQSALLARPSFATYPVFRGGAIARAFACLEIPAHPATFGDQDPKPELWGRPLVEQMNADKVCAGCHQYIDSAGFALEHFDASGRFRDTDNGAPVNARGELRYAEESQPFDGAAELAELIVASPRARDCFVRQWQTFAYGTTSADADACAQQQLTERFEASGGNILDLIVGLTQTDTFSYRAIPEDQP